MPNEQSEIEEKEETVQLPKWYLQIERAASKLFAGCVTAEIIIFFGVKYVLKPAVIEIMHMLVVPFGILCSIICGFQGLDTISRALDIIKKIKEDGK